MKLIFPLILLAASLAGRCPSASDSPEPQGSVRVIVADCLDRDVPAARVSVTDASGVSKEVRPDGSLILEPGRCRLLVTSPAHKPFRTSFEARPGAAIKVHLNPVCNMVRNPGFEEAGWGGPKKDQRGVGLRWETVCGGPHPEIYSLDRAVAHSGRRSQTMACEGYNCDFGADPARCYHLDAMSRERILHPVSGIALGNQCIAQVVEGEIEPGCEYQLSAWVKIEGLTAPWEWFRLGIYWLDSDGEFIGEAREPETDKPNYGTHDWKLLTARGVAPSGAARAKVYLHHHFEHGTVWYDDVCFADRELLRASARPPDASPAVSRQRRRCAP
jgi:hypothetical protein